MCGAQDVSYTQLRRSSAQKTVDNTTYRSEKPKNYPHVDKILGFVYFFIPIVCFVRLFCAHQFRRISKISLLSKGKFATTSANDQEKPYFGIFGL
ncbi:hypothetical protein DFQ00_107221 [Paenibacillus barcinonensis]|uniref:Uncharacterized protein n=1 Tax=Paenibacillus barcinonensis TaxID=198119 RepID=A0A2V4WC30_PAEBA|nr:hypothetical protein DFQ00_107221 [Paenibacillus barcinonensis]